MSRTLPTLRGRRARAAALLASASVLLAACGGSDDGTGVRNIGADGSASASGSGSGSGSGSASGIAPSGSATPGGPLGAYEPVSDVTEHARITLDLCDVDALLPSDGTPDYAGIAEIYTEGRNSRSDDGFRTLAGNATAERDEPLWDRYEERFGAGWLDAFVTAALEGTGPFEGEADAVRRQGIQKGLTNQVMVAWIFHEADAARAKLEAGETDPATGAPHNVDEIWAFHHGTAPQCSPFTTAEKRGADFGTDSAANDRILAATEAMRDAAVAGDLAAFDVAYDELVTAVLLPYVQATEKYAVLVTDDLAADDAALARIHQAEGWAFFRVVEPFVAEVDAAAADEIAGVLDLANEPAADSGERVRAALAEVLDGLGLDAETVGTFSG